MNRQQLIEDNLNLVYSVLHKHYPTFVKDEDMVQVGYLGLVKAANKWDEEKGIFSSYAFRGIRNEIRNEVRKRMNGPKMVSLDYEIKGDDGKYTTLGDLLVGTQDVEYVSLNDVLEQFTDKEKCIFQLFESGMSCEEISEELGCSNGTVYKVVRKVRKLLKGD